MPSYKPYAEATQGFLLGRKMAKEDRLDKQQETGREALSGMLQKEYPDQNFSGMDTGSMGTVFAFRKAKEAEALAQKKELRVENNAKIGRTLDVFTKVVEAAKSLDGKARRTVLSENFASIGGVFKQLGVEFPYDKMKDIIANGSDKTVSYFFKEMTNYSKAVSARAITPEQFKQSLQSLTEEASELDKNEYDKVKGEIDRLRKDIEPKKEPMGDADLIQRALKGDKEAAAIIREKQRMGIELAGAKTNAALDAKLGTIDIPGTAQAILDGRETIDNVRNTFGVPIQETIRKAVIAQDPAFNFNQPRATASTVKSSLGLQEKQRGMMGSFVANLDKQVSRVDNIMTDVVKRVGFRAIDLPLRELKTRVKGSGQEKVVEAYLTEISNEIGKLSTGSSASVRELSTEAQDRWAKIHDPNLSIKELKIILDETKAMGKMRLESTDQEIKRTTDRLGNVRQPRGEQAPSAPQSKFKILKVE